MHTKNNRVRNILVVSLLVLATSISAGFYFSRPQTIILANNEHVPQTLPEKPAKVVMPQSASQEILSEMQNDITVEITSAKVINTGVEIGICYITPDNGEWRPMPGHLFYSEYEIFPDEIEFALDEKLADGKNTGTRCALIRYRIDNMNTLVPPIEFSILQIYAPGREMYTPCQELQQRLDTNSKAESYGLKAECTETNDGSISVTLVGHDKSVTKDEASKTLDEIAKGEVVGPWKFIINEIER